MALLVISTKELSVREPVAPAKNDTLQSNPILHVRIVHPKY